MPASGPSTLPSTHPATAPTTGPSTGPATAPGEAGPAVDAPRRLRPNEQFVAGQRSQRANAGAHYAQQQAGGRYRLESLLRVSLAGGMLRVEGATLSAPAPLRVEVEGSDAIWAILPRPQWVAGGVMAPSGPTDTNIMRFDRGVTDDAEIWSTTVSQRQGVLRIYGQSVVGRVTYTQAANEATLAVTEWAEGGNGQGVRMDNVFTARAPTLRELRGNDPVAFRKYMVPLLAKISDLSLLRPGAADVYGTFAAIPADDRVAARVRALLPDLDDDAFPVRDEASAQLAVLGAPGVLAILRLDTSDLTGEQRGRLSEAVGRHRRREIADPAAAVKDAEFLIDCLEYEDVAVRAAAKAALEGQLGQPLQIDVTAAAAAAARTAGADAVRTEIARRRAAAATTQPATKPSAGARS